MKALLEKMIIMGGEFIFFLLFLTIFLPLQGIQWIWEEWRSSFCHNSDGGMYAVMAQRMRTQAISGSNKKTGKI